MSYKFWSVFIVCTLLLSCKNEKRKNGVGNINYADSNGIVFRKTFFTCSGKKLVMLERQTRSGLGFLLNKRMTFSYYADDSLTATTGAYSSRKRKGKFNADFLYAKCNSKLTACDFQLHQLGFPGNLQLLPNVPLQVCIPGK